jgi:hypothetical protein
MPTRRDFTVYRGDSWLGVTDAQVSQGANIIPASTAISIELIVPNPMPGQAPYLDLTLAAGAIAIDPSGLFFVVKPVVCDWPPGLYPYSCKVIFAGSPPVVYTAFAGFFSMVDNVTHT